MRRPPAPHAARGTPKINKTVATVVLAVGVLCCGGVGLAAALAPSGDKQPGTPRPVSSIGAEPVSAATPTGQPADQTTTAAAVAVSPPAAAKSTAGATTKAGGGATATKKTTKPATSRPATVYYQNCTAVKAAGAAPLYRGQPGYRAALDRDGDGVACET
jgi:hypothetical protein